jgi:1-acyl-sn-glycerol-3-phosphate acyltransferase
LLLVLILVWNGSVIAINNFGYTLPLVMIIKILLAPFRLLYCMYAFISFVVIMLFIFPVAVIASFWGKVKGGNVIYRASHFWADCWMFSIGIRHKNIFISPVNANKQYIFIANHISYLDIPMIFKSIRKKKFRVLGKIEMKKVPVFGFIYKNAVIMVDRSNHTTRSKSVRQLKSVLQKGISLFIFPEGTFNETHHPLKDFYDGAFRMAIETNTPIKPIIFPDTYDRMNYKSLFMLNPGKCRAIFLDEIDVTELTLEDVQTLKQRVYKQMETALIENKVRWIES